MRTVVGRQLDDRAAEHSLREFQDVPHGRATKAIQTLILIAHHTKIPCHFAKLQEQLFLNVVRVLVLIDQNVLDLTGYRPTSVRNAKEVVNEPLQAGEIDAVAVEERFLVV